MTKKYIKDQLKADLLKGKRISTLTALNLYGTIRIAEFARQLRKEKLRIATVKQKTRDGIYYGVYVLRKFLKDNDVLWDEAKIK